MYTAAELLAAVDTRYRRRFPLHAERAFGEFPPTWRLWFLAIEARPGAVTGAPATDWVNTCAKRPLRAPPKAAPPLSRVRALRALMRTGWDPALREERGLRALSATLSAIVHVGLLVLFFWAAVIRVVPLPSESDAGDVTLVEFIGEGTPETPGDAAPVAAMEEAQRGQPASAASAESGAADAQADAAPEAAADAPASADSMPVSEDPAQGGAAQPVLADTQPPSASEPAVADVETPAPPQAAQPLAVTETPVPDSRFTLPSTTLRIPQRPAVLRPPAETVAPAPSREIPLVDRSTPAAPALPLPRRPAIAVQEAPAPVPTREIPLAPRPTQTPALPLPQTRRVALPDVAAPSDGREIVLAPRPQAGAVALPVPGASQPPLPETEVGRTGSSREIPLRARTAASGRDSAVGNASAGSAREGSAPAGRPDTDGSTARGTARTTAPAPSGRPGGSARSGAGPRPASPPGGLPAPARGDDWGVSDRDRPGSGVGRDSGPGLFNGDGSVRLPGDGGRVGGGLPPGTITEDFEKIDRMGTWLRRPPVDYTPSRFDKIFQPTESLLEEWVRKNVREVYVPIPGTNKRLRCVVSILQAAGGCTIDDPNLRDQEAQARPPPTVPYKQELQDKE